MSLVSFPRRQITYDLCDSPDLPKVTLTYAGTSNAPLAHSIDPAPPPKKLSPDEGKKTLPKAKQKPVHKEESPEMIRLRKKAENMKKGKEEFLEKGIMTALYGVVEQKVKCACMSTDHLLVQKRTRLRELLLAEEVAYTSEYVAMCQQANANREEQLRRKAFDVQTKYERERKQFVDSKLLERVVDNCDAARPVLTQKYLMEVKKDQLWQIKEKYALAEAKREEEKMYHDLMMKNMMALKQNEEETAKLAWMKQKDARRAFDEQMKWKQEKDEKERQLKELERMQLDEEIRLIREEDEKEKLDQIRRKNEMKAEFKEILAREREIKEERKREEEEIDRTFAKLMKIEEENEKMKGSSEKERLKREMDIFLQSSRELKRQREEEERKLNETLQELNDKKREQKDAERRKIKAAKQELFSEMLRGRDEQIREKREREMREEEQRNAEIKLLTLQLEQQQKIREDFERRCAQQREEYRQQLLQQIQKGEDAKRKQKEDEDEYVRLLRQREDEEIAKVKKILQHIPIKSTDHPMKVIVRDQQPKYMCPYPCPR
ncbi:hypothetical protein RUM44_011488 [Polyplax serrata]|uniref:Cilia- and flagella-associated protein 53 n=1 Tax=Polyplax serrata TaxID=468196 RepID=A0ABR1AQI2_POLSC